MRSALPAIASELGSDESTLRRAILSGTVRASRPRPRALELATGELDYLRGHWTQLGRLKAALRTEPSVALAVLYGSMARGDDTADSDLDVLVAFKDGRAAAASVGARLSGALDRHTDVAILPVVRKQTPLLLLRAVDEGRVLVDRRQMWRSLKAQRETIARAARRSVRRQELAVARSLEDLLGEWVSDEA